LDIAICKVVNNFFAFELPKRGYRLLLKTKQKKPHHKQQQKKQQRNSPAPCTAVAVLMISAAIWKLEEHSFWIR